jgi:hypothetical protein
LEALTAPAFVSANLASTQKNLFVEEEEGNKNRNEKTKGNLQMVLVLT